MFKTHVVAQYLVRIGNTFIDLEAEIATLENQYIEPDDVIPKTLVRFAPLVQHVHPSSGHCDIDVYINNFSGTIEHGLSIKISESVIRLKRCSR